jgi:hypothetical protein
MGARPRSRKEGDGDDEMTDLVLLGVILCVAACVVLIYFAVFLYDYIRQRYMELKMPTTTIQQIWGAKETIKIKEMPIDRPGLTRKFEVYGENGVVTVYITTGEYKDGSLGELKITISKHGNEMRLLDAIANSISIGLQHGIPLKVYVEEFKYVANGTSGVTNNKKIPLVKSILDFVARYLENRYLNGAS